jgi:hypothetical protein
MSMAMRGAPVCYEFFWGIVNAKTFVLARLIDKTSDEKRSFLHDTMHADFILKAARF